MKKISRILPMLMLAMTLLLSSQVNAQPSISNNCNTVVGSACVGSCSPIGVINYNVGPLCPSAVVSLCVVTKSSSLCPSHIASAKVYVNGVLTAHQKIHEVGTTISFDAPCGAQIKVVATTTFVNPNIQCVWLGNVDFELRK